MESNFGSGGAGEGDGDQWLSTHESNLLAELEKATGTPELELEKEEGHRRERLWVCFQSTSTSIAKVYVSTTPDREHHHHHHHRSTNDQQNPSEAFRLAAHNSTMLYKESLESMKKLTDLARAEGYARKTKEIFGWAKKKRKFIRREDLLSYLVGRSKPQPLNVNNQQQQQPSQHFFGDLDPTFKAAINFPFNHHPQPEQQFGIFPDTVFQNEGRNNDNSTIHYFHSHHTHTSNSPTRHSLKRSLSPSSSYDDMDRDSPKRTRY